MPDTITIEMVYREAPAIRRIVKHAEMIRNSGKGDPRDSALDELRRELDDLKAFRDETKKEREKREKEEAMKEAKEAKEAERKRLAEIQFSAWAEIVGVVTDVRGTGAQPQVVDTFYVKDMFGLKLHQKARQEALERKLRQAIAEGAERAQSPS